MKTHEITTSKVEFVVVDLDSDQKLYEIQDMLGYCLEKISTWFKLSEATEEDAKLVVDEPEYIPCYNCLNGCTVCSGYGY